MSSPRKAPTGKKAKHVVRRSPSRVVWAVSLLLLGVLAGGAYYYHDMQQKAAAEQARLRAEAKRRAAEQRAREEAERAAAEQAERERLAAEERARREAEEQAERERLAAEERARREAEERAAREAAEQKPVPEEETDDEEKPEPEPTPEVVKGPYAGPLVLVGTAALDKSATEAYEAMLDRVLKEHDFKDFAAAFKGHIAAAARELVNGDQFNYQGFRSSNSLVSAVDWCLVCDTADEAILAELASGSPEDAQSGRAFCEWLRRDKSRPLHELLRWFMLQEGRPENLGYSLKMFYELWKVCPPRERSRYLNLAIACALVRPDLANSSGMLIEPKEPLLSMPEVFTYFREQDTRRKLLTNIQKMSVERLLNVVDVRLTRSEFQWVHDNLKYKRKNWGEAYGSIRYRMDRAANNVSPYKTYTFAELRKEGGVCRDQAYFCGMTSKCMGIPSIYAVGDGDRGGHAWTVLLVDDQTWVPINNYGYTTGRFLGVCSGRSMHESVYLNQTRAERADKLAPAGDAMIFSYVLARADAVASSRGVARYLTGAFPTLTASWVTRLVVLETDADKHPVSVKTWRKMDNELQRAASKNAELLDLAGMIEDKYLSDGKSVGARKSEMDRRMRSMKRNVGDARADLVVSTIGREAKLLAEAKNFRALATLYKKQLKEYTGRGDIFGELLGQYMGCLTEAEADERTWASMAKDVEKLYEKKVRSGGGDYFKLNKELQIQKQVADCWEHAGNLKKAQKLREDADTRLEAAKSQYKTEGSAD